MSALLVALGAAVGAVCRYAIHHRVRVVTRPTATALINVSGSLVLGVVTALLARHPSWPQRELALVLGTGLCGAFTTFSSFVWEAISQWEAGQRRRAILHVVGQPLLGVGAAWLGLWLGS